MHRINMKNIYGTFEISDFFKRREESLSMNQQKNYQNRQK